MPWRSLRLDNQEAVYETCARVCGQTGLRVFGTGEWLEEKHETGRKHRSWRKLHLGLDLLSSEILCADLMLESIGDTMALPDLLGQIDMPVARFIADGAYNGAPVSNLAEARFGNQIEIIIPPPEERSPERRRGAVSDRAGPP